MTLFTPEEISDRKNRRGLDPVVYDLLLMLANRLRNARKNQRSSNLTFRQLKDGAAYQAQFAFDEAKERVYRRKEGKSE